MNRYDELMTKKGAELIVIARQLEINVNTNKEGTSLKESKKSVAEKIVKREEILEKAAKMAAKVAEAKKAPKKARTKLTDEEKKARRQARYAKRVEKREKIMAGRDPKTELFEFDGKSMTLTEWSKEINIPRKKLYGRIYYRGWSVERAFTTL